MTTCLCAAGLYEGHLPGCPEGLCDCARLAGALATRMPMVGMRTRHFANCLTVREARKLEDAAYASTDKIARVDEILKKLAEQRRLLRSLRVSIIRDAAKPEPVKEKA